MESDLQSQTEQLLSKIATLQIKLEVIRSLCEHPEEDVIIKDLNPLGGSTLRKICGHCGKVVGYPSQAEIDDWIG